MDSTPAIDSRLFALGEWIGLVTGSGDNPNINTSWFEDPINAMEQMPDRMNDLVSLVDSLLGPSLTTAPDVFTDASWYPLPDPSTGNLTPFHLVVAAPADTSGQLGLGVLHAFALGNLSIEAFAYLPLFSYSPSGIQFIADSPQNPCQIGLYITTSDSFTVNGVTFTALKIDTGIFFSDTAPTFTLTFENLKNTTAPSTYTTLAALLDPTVDTWIGEVIVQGSFWLNLYVGSSTVTVGDLLTAANFLSKDTQGEYHLDLTNLQGQSPQQIALNFVFAVLNALASLDIPLVMLPGGGIYITNNVGENSTDYGVRIAADLALTTGQTDDGPPPPAITLSLGTWLPGETDADNWISQITSATNPPAAGLSLFLLNQAGNTSTFAPSFTLTSIGIDIEGGGDAPLIDLDGYTLKGVQARGYVESPNATTTTWQGGGAVYLDTVGFPLGPNLAATEGGGGANAVASNLLASGSPQPNTNTTPAVNPGFSAIAGYISGYNTPLLQIFDLSGAQTDTIWFPMQRRFGPINCSKVGIQFIPPLTNPSIGLIFDGDISLAALDVALDQLSIDVPLKTAYDLSTYSLDLQGLDITFNAGGVDISGGLFKTTDSNGNISYDGEALIKAEDLTLSALGAYSSLPDNGGTSMFIFAILNAPIGGPAFFFITGLAAGFGYNRSLKIPALSDVQDFPLLAGLVNTALFGGSSPSPAQVLATLEEWVPVAAGEYWLAAGIQFTTFEIINTNAVLIVEFGNDLVISVLGVSTLQQPQVGESYVYAQLNLEVVFEPAQGLLQASAMLATSSYVLTKEAHLTGGFAFYAWFGDNAHAGDFVFTLGGYHPAFTVPSYYPQEPQLGINWQVSDAISVVGGVYFAITPTAMMAGGALSLTFADGPLKAWLKAAVDVILFWNPFYLIGDASISIGVSLRVHVLFVDVTLSVEISADFYLYGPPIGGTAHVDWYILSFTISFGADLQTTPELTWDGFKGMLPTKTQQSNPAPGALIDRAMGEVTAPQTTTTTPAYLHINANAGLISTQTLQGVTLWLVRPAQFQFSVGSAIPASSIVIDSLNPGDDLTLPGLPVGIRGVGASGGISSADYRSTQTVTILKLTSDAIASILASEATTNPCTTQPAGAVGSPVNIADWQALPVTSNLPAAMWGDPVPSGQTPNINPTTPTVAATAGVTMQPHHPTIINCTPQMVIDTIFADRAVNAEDEYRLPLAQTQQPSNAVPVAADSYLDIAEVNTAAIVANRTALFTALQGMGVNAWTNAPLPLMAASPGRAFADEPMEGSPVAVTARRIGHEGGNR